MKQQVHNIQTRPGDFKGLTAHVQVQYNFLKLCRNTFCLHYCMETFRVFDS